MVDLVNDCESAKDSTHSRQLEPVHSSPRLPSALGNSTDSGPTSISSIQATLPDYAPAHTNTFVQSKLPFKRISHEFWLRQEKQRYYNDQQEYQTQREHLQLQEAEKALKKREKERDRKRVQRERKKKANNALKIEKESKVENVS